MSGILEKIFFGAWICVLAPCCCLGQSVSTWETWRSADGQSSVEAQLIKQDATTLTLVQKDGKELTVEKRLLDLSQVLPIHKAWLIEQDEEQFYLTFDLLKNLPDYADATGEAFLALHLKYPTAPYAGVAAGVAMSHALNENKRAIGILRDVVRRIEVRRKLAPEAHQVTLSSALNNLALCYVKDGKVNQAAYALTTAVKGLKETPLEIYHNATLLQKLGQRYSALNMDDSSRRLLFTATATKRGNQKYETSTTFFAYRLKFDFPTKLPGVEEVVDAKDGSVWTGCGGGTGFCVADGWVLTNEHVVTLDDLSADQLKFKVVVGTGPQKIDLEVTKVIIADERRSGLDLALLQVPGLSANPLVLAETDPLLGSSISILGYPETWLWGENLKVSSGVINSEAQFIRGQHEIITDAVSGKGNSGGPAFHLSGKSVGVLFAISSPGAMNGGRSHIVPGELTRRWVVSQLGESLLRPESTAVPATDLSDLVSQVRDSIFVINAYKDVSAIGVLQDDAASDEEFILDRWCLNCDGRGFLACASEGCVRGQIPRKVRKMTGYNRVLNVATYGDVTVFDPCKNCKQSGRVDCEFCEAGKLSPDGGLIDDRYGR
jgi:S1-C subfamily serine protease